MKTYKISACQDYALIITHLIKARTEKEAKAKFRKIYKKCTDLTIEGVTC